MKAHSGRPGSALALAAVVLAAGVMMVFLGACRHLAPVEPAPEARPSAAPAAPTASASMRPPRPAAPPAATATPLLPLPAAPELTAAGLGLSPGRAILRPEPDPVDSWKLPLPVILAAPPRIGPSYALIERAVGGRRPAGPAPGGGPAASAPPKRTPRPAPRSATVPSAVSIPDGPAAGAAGSTADTAAIAGRSAPRAAPKTLESGGSREAVRGGEIPGSREAGGAGEVRQIRQEVREVLARRGDPVELQFEGEGWLFTSLGRSGGDDGSTFEGLEFEGSSSQQGRTRFSFVARGLGEYLLSFQAQNHSTGALSNEVVRLRVLDDAAFVRELRGAAGAAAPGGATGMGGSMAADSAAGPEDATIAGGLDGGAAGAAAGRGTSGAVARSAARPGPPVPQGEQWFELGEFDLALGEYLRAGRPEDPYLNDRIGACYAAMGEHPAAVRYYLRNLGAPTEYGERAAAALVRSGLALQDEGLLAESTPALLASAGIPVGEELLGLARFHMERGRAPLAMRLLQEFERRYPLGRGLDEVLYRMAQLYESESALRDLEAARDTYRRVYDDWPESPFSELAYGRLRYLQRHFFEIR
ncbi:MAG: tetratricopeptide repeat protein [Spirochaetales bacterium]|nr:tetratricopeptide repeat protein [Spirochaetales bacterium]